MPLTLVALATALPLCHVLSRISQKQLGQERWSQPILMYVIRLP